MINPTTKGGTMDEYLVTHPMLPPREKRRNPESPIMDERDMEYWLNDMSEKGWEFAGYAQKHWIGSTPYVQDWWIFKREK